MQKVGRGRGIFQSKTLNQASPIKVGRGKFLNSPDQPNTTTANQTIEATVIDNQFDEAANKQNEIEKLSELEISDMGTEEEEEDMQHGIIDSTVNMNEIKRDGSIQKIKDSLDTEIQKKELEWQEYQFKRKINGILKDVNDGNIGDIVSSLQLIIEERPLSSRYVSSSESKKLIETLISKSIDKDGFLKYGPCLLKTVADQDMIEFQQYFYDIATEKKREYITLCASDDIISQSGQRFSQFMGHLFTMPRQTSRSFFDLVSGFVEECIEKWTYPEGSGGFDGSISEGLALVQAVAVRHILLEISNKMLSCDDVIMKRMEKFTWFVYETVFNHKIPRKLREVFLETYVQLQSSGSTAASTNITTTDQETDNDDVIVESEEIMEDTENEQTQDISDEDENFNESIYVEEGEGTENTEEESDEAAIGTRIEDILSDPYLCVKYLLHKVESEEYLQTFIDYQLDDSVLKKPNLKKVLQEAGFESIFIFNLHMLYSRLGHEKTYSNAIEHARKVNSIDTNTERTTLSKQSSLERPHSRMAMNFSTKTPPVETNSQQFNFPYSDSSDVRSDDNSMASGTDNLKDNIDDDNADICDTHNDDDGDTHNDDDDDDDDDDEDEVIIEGECLDDSNNDKGFLIKESQNEDKSEAISSYQANKYDEALYKVTIGRGRGFGLKPGSKPVANVQPMPSNQRQNYNRFNKNENYNKGSEQGNWRSPGRQRTYSPKSHERQRAYSPKSHERQRAYSPKSHERNNRNRDSKSFRDYHQDHHRSNKYNSKQPVHKFNPVYHPKEKPKVENNTEQRTGFGFGVSSKVHCTACDNYGHTAEYCNSSNPFF